MGAHGTEGRSRSPLRIDDGLLDIINRAAEKAAVRAAQKSADSAAQLAADRAVAKMITQCETIAQQAAERAYGALEQKIKTELDKQAKLNEDNLKKCTAASTATGSGGGGVSTVNFSLAGGQASNADWCPSQLEFQGWVVDWSDPETTALLVDEACVLVDIIVKIISPLFVQYLDITKTKEMMTRMLLTKIVMHTKDCSRDKHYELCKHINTKLKANAQIKNYFTNPSRGIYCMVQVSPERRPLRQQAGKWYSMLEALNIPKSKMKLEYQGKDRIVVRAVPAQGSRPERIADYISSNGGWAIHPACWTVLAGSDGPTKEEAYGRLRM